MDSTCGSKKCGSVFFGIALAVLGVLFGSSLRAQAPNPVPLINQPLVPDATAPGGPQFTLTINGTGFVSNSTVNWNGSPLATTFVSGSQLTATVPAADIATASTGWVTVVNPAPGGGTSNTAFLTVTGNTGNSLAFTLASSPGVNYGPIFVATGDFNNDGKLDLVVVNEFETGSISILLGDGTGNFTLASTYEPWGAVPFSVAVGDFNRDGKLDLAVADAGDATVSIFVGDGTGNFTLLPALNVGYEPNAIVAGDFNGDGNLDLAVANRCGTPESCPAGTVSVLLGDGTGSFTLASSPATGSSPDAIVEGDFNGDGKLDLAVANQGDNTVSILLGDGAGNFTPAPSPAVGNSPVSIAVGDLNGDGKLDLAVANNASNTVSVLLGDGTGNFTLAASPTTGNYPNSVAVGDFNGDGNPDLAVANWGSNTLSILLGDGTGNFTLVSSPATGIEPSSVATGDFNGDGMLDLAAANFGYGFRSTVSILLQLPPSPTVTLSPTSLSFPTQLLGTTSSPQNVTLTNSGSATLNITSIAASANFSQINTCGTTLAAGASCTITVTFTPVGVGTLTGNITITDNASNSPQTVSLTGVGTEVTLSPSSLNFYKQSVGTTSAPQTITLTNLGDQALIIAAIHVGGADAGDFAQTNTCGRGIAAGSSCAISVTFTPQAKGSRQAVVGVRDNGGASPQTVSLRGYGM